MEWMLGGESVFLLLVGMGPGLCRVMVRFGGVLRLPARNTLGMGGWERMWYAFVALLWVTLGAVCVGGFGVIFWLRITMCFARGAGGGLLCLFPCLGLRGIHRVYVEWCGEALGRSGLHVLLGIL